MAEAKLLEMLKVSQEVTKLGRSNVCVNQCTILLTAFKDSGEFFTKALALKLREGQTSSLLWYEAASVLYKGIQLLESCQDEDWITRTLLFEDSREDFEDVYTELYDCIELVSVHLFHLASNDVQRSKVFQAYKSCFMRKNSLNMLKMAAVNDRKELMKMALKQEEALQTKAMLTPTDQALQMVCAKLLEKTPGGGSALQLGLTTDIRQGSFGTVYEAAWLGRTLAVKVFSPGDSHSFARELDLLTSHAHPNVLHIVGHSYDSEKLQYSLISERMEMDLASYILKMKKPVTLVTGISILVQVASGMTWLHSKNMCHGELKPENILVKTCLDDEHVVIRISDAGLARTEEKARSGAMNFTAPEVWSSERYSKKADVYSFAMVCYYVLTGTVPFQDIVERRGFMDMVCNGNRPELPQNLMSEVGEVVRRCWSQDPNERPRFKDLLDELKICRAKLLTGINATGARSELLAFQNAQTQERPALRKLFKLIPCYRDR